MKKILLCFCLFLMACNESEDNPPQQAQQTEEAIQTNPVDERKAVIEDIKAMYSTKIRIIKSTNETKKLPVTPQTLSYETLSAVKGLFFNGEKIYFIPAWWKDKFKNLTRLELRNTGLSASEAVKLGQLTSLQELDLSDNPFFSPESKESLTSLWENLPQLRVLKLSSVGGNETQIGDLSKLTALEELDLSFNTITNLKNLKINGLSRLKRLNLGHNQASSFSFADIPITAVQELSLEHNNISILGFDNSFSGLTVRQLNLRENSQIKISEGFAGLFAVHYLEELNVDADAQVPVELKEKLQRHTEQRYQLSHDKKTVIDTQNHLEWQRCIRGRQLKTVKKRSKSISVCQGKAKVYDWQEAIIEALKVNEQERVSSWRLPTYQELKTLACSNNSLWIWDDRRDIPCEGQFKRSGKMQKLFLQTPLSCFWSSSRSSEYESKAWRVNFDTGEVVRGPKKEKCYVRLVRNLR